MSQELKVPSLRQRVLEVLQTDPEGLARVMNLYDELQNPTRVTITSPSQAADVLRPYFFGQENELLVAVALRKKKVMAVERLSLGSADYTIVCPKRILRWLLTLPGRPDELILAHNHPSGDCLPSDPDRMVTRRVREATRTVGIRFLDHLIVTGTGFYSFAEREPDVVPNEYMQVLACSQRR